MPGAPAMNKNGDMGRASGKIIFIIFFAAASMLVLFYLYFINHISINEKGLDHKAYLKSLFLEYRSIENNGLFSGDSGKSEFVLFIDKHNDYLRNYGLCISMDGGNNIEHPCRFIMRRNNGDVVARIDKDGYIY